MKKKTTAQVGGSSSERRNLMSRGILVPPPSSSPVAAEALRVLPSGMPILFFWWVRCQSGREGCHATSSGASRFVADNFGGVGVGS